MMFRVLIAALVLVCAPLVLCTTVVLTPSAPSFKDPVSSTNHAILDIYVPTVCVDSLVIQVTLPTTWNSGGNNEANAVLTGPAFSKVVTGTSMNAAPAGSAANVNVAWDPVANTLTFSGFAGSNAIAPWDGVPGWSNVNFDIPDTDFHDVGGAVSDPFPLDHTFVPLALQYMATYLAAVANHLPKSIVLTGASDFYVTADLIGEGLPENRRCGNAGPHGDPVFAGFQGQEFQFHGLPDEHFNLVSSPDVSVNSHFVYLSSGKCDYNDTECFTHPGTYMDVLGFSIGQAHIKLVAGTHDAGLRVWFNDQELTRGTFIPQLSANITQASLKYTRHGRVLINTDIMGFEIVNSDMFMNIRTSLNNPQLLRIGATKHTVTDANICKTNGETYNYQLVESTVAKKYPVTTPLHGLMGQTWRNVKVCGHDWMGTVQDYLVSDLFANDNHYNYFKW